MDTQKTKGRKLMVGVPASLPPLSLCQEEMKKMRTTRRNGNRARILVGTCHGDRFPEGAVISRTTILMTMMVRKAFSDTAAAMVSSSSSFLVITIGRYK